MADETKIHFNIEINKQLAMQEVEKITSYRSSKQAPEAYDTLRFTKPDTESLDIAWHEACDLLAMELAAHLCAQYYSEHDHFVMEVNFPDTLRKSIIPTIRSRAFTLAVTVLLHKWYLLSGDDDGAAMAAEDIDRLSSNLKKLIAMRSKGVRLKAHPFP